MAYGNGEKGHPQLVALRELMFSYLHASRLDLSYFLSPSLVVFKSATRAAIYSELSISLDTLRLTHAFKKDVTKPCYQQSALSGVMKVARQSWFARDFTVSEDLLLEKDHKLIINFEAVDYQATVYVNDKPAGNNTGGYWRFSFDITDLVKTGTNTLRVDVFDPTDAEG